MRGQARAQHRLVTAVAGDLSPSLSQGLSAEAYYLPNTPVFSLWITIPKVILEYKNSLIFIFGHKTGCGEAQLQSLYCKVEAGESQVQGQPELPEEHENRSRKEAFKGRVSHPLP